MMLPASPSSPSPRCPPPTFGTKHNTLFAKSCHGTRRFPPSASNAALPTSVPPSQHSPFLLLPRPCIGRRYSKVKIRREQKMCPLPTQESHRDGSPRIPGVSSRPYSPNRLPPSSSPATNNKIECTKASFMRAPPQPVPSSTHTTPQSFPCPPHGQNGGLTGRNACRAKPKDGAKVGDTIPLSPGHARFPQRERRQPNNPHTCHVHAVP